LSYQIRFVLRASALERELRAPAGGAPQPSAAEQMLRERCEAILREALPFRGAAPAGLRSPEQACLERIAQLASEAVAGEDLLEVLMGHATALAPGLDG
jgi:hypothetical protein